MTPIFITGQDQANLPPLLQALHKQGLGVAQPLARDANMHLSHWHERVQAHPSAAGTQPGRVWEQIAAELLAANIHQNQWAWADTQLLQRLDFWAGFEPSIRFVLLAETPLHLVSTAPDDHSALLHSWTQTHSGLLRFALSHPERCLLVWGHQARQTPQTLSQRMAVRWGLQLTGAATSAAMPPACALAQHLAEQLCQQHPQAQQLLADLHACVEPLLPTNPTHGAQALIGRYRELLKASHNSPQLQALQKDLQAQATRAQTAEQARQKADEQLKQTQSQLKQAQDQAKQVQEQSKQAQEHIKQAQEQSQKAQQQQQQAQEQLKQAQAKTATSEQALKTLQAESQKLQAQHKEAQEEAELLLNQLHVVQEELENYYYRNKELQAQAETLGHLQQRWRQLFEQHRNLYAVESVRIEADASSPNTFQCQLDQLDMAGRHFDRLTFGLNIAADGCAVLQLQRPDAQTPAGCDPLMRWPTHLPAGHTLTLHPSLGTDTPAEQVAAYLQLTTTDWQLVQDLHHLVLTALPQIPNLSAEQQQTLTAALQCSSQQLRAMATMLRFDSATCLTPPTEQQLHLLLLHVSHQQRHAGQMALQVQRHSPEHSSLHIEANALTGQAPLSLDITPAGWNAMQLASLSEDERQRLTLLLATLPLALVDAAQQGTDKESLKPWAQTARTLRHWTQHPQAPAPAKPRKAPKAAKPEKTEQPPKASHAPKTAKPATAPSTPTRTRSAPRATTAHAVAPRRKSRA